MNAAESKSKIPAARDEQKNESAISNSSRKITVVSEDVLQQSAANDEVYTLEKTADSSENKRSSEGGGTEIALTEGKEMMAAETVAQGALSLRDFARREGKIRIGLVDASSLMESRARDIADDRLATEKGELHGVFGWCKKVWKYNLAAEYYRQKEIALAREQIIVSGSAFIDRPEGERRQSAHQAAMGAIVDRFVTDGEEMLHEGEVRSNADNGEANDVSQALKDLVLRYGRGEIADDQAFETEKQQIVNELKGDNASVKFADNLFEVAKQVKQAIDHGESVEALQNDLEVIEGGARAGVRTEAHLSTCDRLIEKLHGTRLGALVNETTLALAVGAAWSVGTFVGTRLTSSKIAALASFGGTAALGSGMAAMRESAHIRRDRAIDARDRAQGKEIDPENGKRRKEMESSVYEMKGASELAHNMQAALFETNAEGEVTLKQNIGEREIAQAIAALSEAEARVRLSDSKNVDLIAYSSAEKVETERFDLDLARAKTKVEVRKLLESHPEMLASEDGKTLTAEEYLRARLSDQTRKIESNIGGEVSRKDAIFESMRRRRMGKTALATLGIGLTIGTVAQEVAAFGNNQQGFVEGMVSGKNPESSSQTLLQYLFGEKAPDASAVTENISRPATVEEWLSHRNDTVQVRRLGWYDNDTVPFDKNELKLHWGGDRGTGIDKDGNFVFSVKQMMQDGSSRGKLSADALALAKEGKLEMILSASKETQGQVIKLPINQDGTVAFDPNNTELAKLFKAEDGKAVFLGKYAEVAEVVKAAGEENPVESVRVLATHIGKDAVEGLTVTEPVTHISEQSISHPDLPPIVPFLPIAGRTPLEKMKKKDSDEKNEHTVPNPKLPPEGDKMPAHISPPQRNFPPRKETAESGFFEKRKKYENDADYYRRFQEFATQTLGLPEDAPYDDIRKNAKKWMQKNMDRVGDAGKNETVLKMTKSLNELKNHQKIRSENLSNARPEKEIGEEKSVMQRKARAIKKLWDRKKNTLALPNGLANDRYVGEVLREAVEAMIRKNRYSSDQEAELSAALQKEGVPMRRKIKKDGSARWIVEDSIEKQPA